MSEQTRLMARLTGALATRDVAAPLADRLIAALVVTLDVDGGAVTIGYSAPDRITLCATDAVATRLEELQDLWRQGPSLDAFRTGEPVVFDLQAQGVRWPLLAQGMTEQYAPVSLFGVPIRPGSDTLGTVSLYRFDRVHMPFDVDDAQFLANAVGVAIVGRFDRAESTAMNWSTRDRINQATGMVVAQLRVPPGDALALLRAHAFAHGVGLAEVSEAVVERSLDFRHQDGGSGR